MKKRLIKVSDGTHNDIMHCDEFYFIHVMASCGSLENLVRDLVPLYPLVKMNNLVFY